MTGPLLRRLRDAITGHGEPAAGEEREYRIRLIVGLGNPGAEHAQNRHNVGFRTVNRLARRHGIELETGGQAALGRGTIAGSEVALAKPRTFVNRSGEAVWNLIKRLELDDARQLLVICDDLDLPVAKVRLRPSGGYGGQKGLQSIIERLRTDQFPRLRIGIGRPVVRGEPSYDPDVIADYVLSDPPPGERALLDEAVERAAGAVELAVAEGVERAMARYN